jgi:hypothetical protein
MTILQAEDRATPDVAASTGTLDLYDGDDGRVGIDAMVPHAVAAEMVKVAAGLGLTGFWLLQPNQGGPTSLQAEVPPDALAAVLAPAEAAGVKIIDDRDVAQSRGVTTRLLTGCTDVE